jgi:ATP-dependent RNA helicase DDX56/DBP9
MELTKSSKSREDNTFTSLAQLDTRILRALADQAFVKPTLVQAKAIPLALEGKDILCRARTGSGKTVAYCVPVLERVLAGRKVVSVDFSNALVSVSSLFTLRVYNFPYRQRQKMEDKPRER